MLVARPTAGVRVKEQTFLVFFAYVVVEILCQRELTMKLNKAISHKSCESLTCIVAYLLQRNTIVFEEKETVVANGNLDFLDKVIDNLKIIRVQ